MTEQEKMFNSNYKIHHNRTTSQGFNQKETSLTRMLSENKN
jgi:hypothetical protein